MTKQHIPAHLQGLLNGLRWRIRAYVFAEGLCLALVWVALTFWAGLALDYLPVMVGASEMPRGVRLVLLIAIAAILAYVLYRWVLRRVFVSLHDRSMAVLLERRFQAFNDGLLTAVELGDTPNYSADMLGHTRDDALAKTESVDLSQVFRYTPLASKFAFACLLLLPVGGFYFTNQDAFQLWVNRLYFLADEPWPRNTQVEVVGIQLERDEVGPGEENVESLTAFDEQQVKVAKGSSFSILVRANANKVIPDYCSIYYRTDEGDRGTITMSKIGRVRDDYQTYIYSGKPFSSILSSLDFDVRGNDHRIRDFRIAVVDSPTIIDTKIYSVYPDYMVNQELSLWLPRTVDLAPGTLVPRGTNVTLQFRANKSLESARIYNVNSQETVEVKVSNQAERAQFEFDAGVLMTNLNLEIRLTDADGVTSESPYRVLVGTEEDQAPMVDVRLRGISNAITADAMLPAKGTIDDDYGVERTWFEVLVNDGEKHELPVTLENGRDLQATLDFRDQRSQVNGIVLKPTDTVTFEIRAADRFNLEGNLPNVGISDRYQLDVVTPDELLALLDRRELGLRRRFEQTLEELTLMRDSLIRLQPDPADSTPENPDSDEEAVDPQRQASLRLIRVQRALTDTLKASQEVDGVANSFDEIRLEIENNRVDAQDRKTRLKEQIADPLHLVVDNLFPQLQQQLKQLEDEVNDPAKSPEATQAAITQANNILLELDNVLQKMLELETFNELLKIVRSLIDDNEDLMKKTRDQQRKSALDLLK